MRRHGVVLQAARGSVPSLAEAIVGGPIRGSWWGHPRGKEIYAVAEAVCADPDVLVCKLVDGKVTYVHRRLWAAFVRVGARRLARGALDRVWNEHAETGAHRARREAWPRWVPSDVKVEAKGMTGEAAEKALLEVGVTLRAAAG